MYCAMKIRIRLDAWGSQTPIANAVAHTAPTAFPPFLSISRPAFVASGKADETIPCFDSANFLSDIDWNEPSIF